ncbi:hypothetical protein BG24_3149 [Burkholderia pseudomallei PB08298010]|nr:hypothetical protein BG24_3149 [Burkholderia pseudomallei PB08298010]
MTTTAVVKHFDVFEQVCCSLAVRPVARGMYPFALQAVEALRRRVDAPMSSGAHRISQIGKDERVQLPDDIALQAAMNFLVRHALLGPALDIRPCSRIATHAHHGNGPQGIICSTVATPVQAMSDRFTRGCLQWARAAKRCESGLAFQAFGIVPRNGNKHCRRLRPDAESFPKPPGVLEGQAFEHGIERLELFRQREEALCQQAQRGCQRLQHRCVAQRAQPCAVGNAFSSLCLQKAFADVLWRAHQQRPQLIDRLRLSLDGAAASNGDGSHRFGRSRLLFGNRRCFSCKDRSRSVFRVGRIGFSPRSTRSSIRTIDLEHLDLVITQHAGQARAIGAGPFNASAAQTTK